MRVINREHADKIAAKLKAKVVNGKAHDRAEIYYGGKLIAFFGLRRGSNKQQGHDHIQRDLHLSGYQAKQLAACPLTLDDWIKIMRDKNLLPE